MQDKTNKNRATRRKLEPRKILHSLQSKFSVTLMIHFNDSYRNFSIFVASLQKGNKSWWSVSTLVRSWVQGLYFCIHTPMQLPVLLLFNPADLSWAIGSCFIFFVPPNVMVAFYLLLQTQQKHKCKQLLSFTNYSHTFTYDLGFSTKERTINFFWRQHQHKYNLGGWVNFGVSQRLALRFWAQLGLDIVSSVRSSNSHPDLLLTQHHHPTFSDLACGPLYNNIGLSLSEPI